tara:strand:- start:45 stop:272 length:228 start_codon:yes stop_codon:yes gene_type:complete
MALSAVGYEGEYNPISWLDLSDALSDIKDSPGSFVSQYRWQQVSRFSVLNMEIASANPSGTDLDMNLTCFRSVQR